MKKTSSTLEIARDEEADETESLTHAKNNEAEAGRLLNSAYQANYENRFNIQEHLGDSATGATGATGVADAERIVMEADSEYLEQEALFRNTSAYLRQIIFELSERNDEFAKFQDALNGYRRDLRVQKQHPPSTRLN